MFRFIAVIYFALFGGPALAQTSNLRSLETLENGRDWASVGRLIIDYGSGFCTATLIADDLIVTAAHCIYDPDTGRKYDIQGYEFQAGWRNGRAESYRKIKAAQAHPDYRLTHKDNVDRIKNDVALLRLDVPIRNSNITPVGMAALPDAGQMVGLISYARGRVNAPSIQETCLVRSRHSGVLVMTCSVDYGASGSPVIIYVNGRPRVVSIISAMADMNGTLVSLGTSLDDILPAILPLMVPTNEFSSANQKRRDIGAKFGRVLPLETE